MVTFVTPPNLIPIGTCKTNGNQIVDVNGNPIRIKAVGWNAGNYAASTALDGFSSLTPTGHIDNMIRLGFNCARILTSCLGILQNQTLFNTYDTMIDYAGTKGFRFIVDIHNAQGAGPYPPNGLWYDLGGASNGTDGGSLTGTITDALFIQCWQSLATRWKNKPGILGYDLQNEPAAVGHSNPGCTWGGYTTGAGVVGVVGSNQDIRSMYQRAGNAIHAIDPNPLIFCESLIDGNSIHPGGDLRAIQNWPVVLNQANKVVYSIHEYGQYVTINQGQAYIDQMMTSWGWMIAQNKYPMFIGEMGGNMSGSNGISAATMAAWANTILPFMNGTWPNTFTFTGSQQGISSDWWVWSQGDGGETDFILLTSWVNPSITAVNAPFLTQLQPFSVAAGPVPVPAPLTGSVTQGTVLAIDERYANITLPSGKPFHYNLIYPAQYNKTLYKYPLYIWLHPDGSGNGWYQGNGDTFHIAGTYEGVALNTVDFRTKWPCFVSMPSADQEQDSAIANWGGWNNTGGLGDGSHFNGETGPNTFALNAMVQSLINQNIGIDPARIYVVGFSLGGIGAEYLMLRYNQVNGNPPLYTAASSTGGVIEIHNFGGPSSADIITMKNVPVWWVSGQGDGTSKPADWNLPMWRGLAGNSNYPTPLGNPTAASAQAGTSLMHFWYDPTMGHSDIAQNGSFYGVNPTIMNWMFAQSGTGSVVVPPPPPTPSPDGTIVLLGSSAAITDNSGNQWTLSTTITITPGSGSFTDAAGNVYTLTSAGAATENGAAISGGSGTSAMAYVAPTVYAQDSASGNWFIWNQSTFTASSAPPVGTSGSVLLNNSIAGSVQNGIAIAWFGGLIYYENFSTNWFSWTGSAWIAASSPIVSPTKTISCNNITGIVANATFNVSGLLRTYNTAPILQISDDNGALINIPTGNTVSNTTFSFTHLGVLPGNHTIFIADAANTNIRSSVITYAAQGNAAKTIIINSLSNLKSNTPFNVSGSLGGYTIKPSLTYSDDGGANNSIISGTTPTLFNFTHPGLLPGNHTIVISDGNNNANTLSYSLTSQPSASSNNSFILKGNTSPLIDSNGNQWTITAGGQVANNGIIDTTTSNIIEMAYSGGLIYQENAGSLWWAWTGAWTPSSGSSVSPLGNTSITTITVISPQGAVVNSPFIVNGSLSGYNVTQIPQFPTTKDFINNFGVGTHIDFTNTVYSNNPTAIGTAMRYLGLNKIRQPIWSGYNVTAYNGLASQGLSLVVDLQNGNSDISILLNAVDQFLLANPGHIIAIEGPNEVVNWPVTFNNQTGIAGANALQQALFAAVRNDSLIATLPVYMYTFGNGDPSQLGTGNQSAFATYGNAHIYPHQSIGGGVTPYTSLIANVPFQVTPITPSLNTVITECGYYTMPDNNYGVTKDVQMRYTLDLMCDIFLLGYPAGFLYELFDNQADPGNTNSELHFGLFNSDFSPKPVANAIHNLITILQDSGTATTLPISFTATGLPNPALKLSLAKSNGITDIIVWAEPTIWNQTTQTQSVGPSNSVTITLPQTVATVKIFDPIISANAQQTLTNISSVTVTVVDHPIIIEVTPVNFTSLSGIPSLQYMDDNSGNFIKLPSGNTTTSTSFTFTHPAQQAGNHNLSITDGNGTFGNISYILSSATSVRNYNDNPGGNKSVWVTPFGDGAIWGANTDLDTIAARHGGFINASNNFGITVWSGAANDPIHTVKATQTYARDSQLTVQLHIPNGAFDSGPTTASNNNPSGFWDTTGQPGKSFSFGPLAYNGQPVTNLQSGDTPLIGLIGEYNDATSDIFGEDQETGNYGYDIIPGLITSYDLDSVRNPNWPRIQHGLRYTTDASFLKSGNTSPTTFNDSFSSLPLHNLWQTGDKWQLVAPDTPQGRGGPNFVESGTQWWVNPFNTNTPINGIYNISNGLQLGLINTPAAQAAYINSQAGAILPYCGGLLNTSQTLYQKYGYWEVTVAVPNIPGFTFQANLENVQITGIWPPEIDLRIYTSANGVQTVLFQIANGGGNYTQFTTSSPTINASLMHTYGINWQPDFITFYIDNIQLGQSPTPTTGAYTTNPMFMFILTASNYIGTGNPNPALLPAYANVQRISVFQNKSSNGGSGDELSSLSWPQKKQEPQNQIISTTFSTPASIITYLNSIAGTKTISGQYIATGPLTPISTIQSTTGKWLGFIEGDLWNFGGTGAPITTVIPILQAYALAGGLVGMSLCMPNPSTGGGIADLNASIANIITTGTAANIAFLNTLNQIAAQLRILQNAGVPVRFRPFHEMNGNWFWWGTQSGTDAQFAQMWIIMHDYLVITQGLTNLYFLYAVNAGIGIGTTIQNRYPGANYVDIVGQDLYTSTPSQGLATYNSLLGFGKPQCISEFGSGSPSAGDINFNLGTLVNTISSTMPQVVSWTNWWDGNAGNPGWGMAENTGVSAALALPRVINRGDFTVAVNTGASYTGNLVAGTTLGIPINTPMPSGLSFWGQQLFWNAQHYPWLFRDSSPGGIRLYCDQNVSANTTILNQMNTDLPTIVQLLKPLRNQHIGGTPLISTPKNGPGNRVDIGPPPLNGTIVIQQSITIDTISNINQGTLFTISGSLNGYTTPPILTFKDDGGSSQSLPSAAVVSTIRFTFTHSSMASGSHSIVIGDGVITSQPMIYVVVPISGGAPNISFLVSPLGTTSTFNIPSNWNNNNNIVEGLGAGGSGANTGSGNGSGAGAYAKIVNYIATPGGTTSYTIGRGGNNNPITGIGVSGGDTIFGNNALVAKGGQGALITGGAVGGQATASIGLIKNSGGNAPTANAIYGAQGAGGAGGPSGTGGNGAQGGLSPSGGGGGAGASDGGGNGTQPDPTGPGGLGGPASTKSAKGGDGGAGSSGLNGISGQSGTTGTEWDTTHGAGSGGGGSGGSNPTFPTITPGVGSFTDSVGNVYTLTVGLSAMENGVAIPGGTGTSAMAYVAPTVYAQDSASGNWFIWNQSTFTPSAAPVGATTGGGTTVPPPTLTDTFTMTGGVIKRKDGSTFYGKGINMNDFVLSTAVGSNAANLLQFFPGTSMVRINIRSFSDVSTVSSYINILTALGIVCLIEAHWVNGNKLALTGSALTNEASWYASWASFFITNPYVWFGTPNEPQDSNGGVDISNEHTAIYNAIRATGSNAIILFQPYGGGNPSAISQLTHAQYLPMHNAGWDLHYYNWMTNFSSDVPTITNQLNVLANTLRSQNPTANGTPAVVIGEWGDSTQGIAPPDNGWQQVVQVVTTNGFSGHMAWHWNVPSDGSTADIFFLNNSLASGLNAFGQMVAAAIGTIPASTLSGNTTSSGSFTNWFESPGQDGRYWRKPFQSSSHWLTSGPIITALRGGTPSIQTNGNFAVPFYIGNAGDPLVTVTDGSNFIVVPIPLGSKIEGPTSSTDQSVGGVDRTHPYRLWSISGAQMFNSSGIQITQVQASGTVIRGTYGFAVQDGAGAVMEDIVTGAPGDNNSIGGIQDLELGLITADPNYVIPHMLAFQTDVSFQASSAGPIWPLKITDVSSGGVTNPYSGPIPQGITIGIPASTPRPTGQTRGFYALWDQLQRFGMLNYNFGQTGGVNFVVYDSTGKYQALVTDIAASWRTIGQNYICILDYNNGVSGAQYSVATTKGAIPGSTDAFPSPPPLDLSPTGGVNVAPSTFNAWYPNTSYTVIPTNLGANTIPNPIITTGTGLTGGAGGNYGGGGGGTTDDTGRGGAGGQGLLVVSNIPVSTGLVWVDAQIFNMFSV